MGPELRKWVRDCDGDPQQSFPGNGRMKPGRLEIEMLRSEVFREAELGERYASHRIAR